MKNRYILIIVSLILFIGVTLLVILGFSYDLEEKVYHFISNYITSNNTSFMKVITHLGGLVFTLIVCTIFLIIPKFSNKVGIPLTLAVLVNGILNFILKNIFIRERPSVYQIINETGYSFPSGHSMNIIAIATMLSLLLFKYNKNKKIAISLIVILFLSSFLVGFSRIYLGVHYFGDVIGGFLIGFAITLIVYYFCDKYILKK